MTKDQISSTLIAAGLHRYLVIWEGSECFVDFEDLDCADRKAITKLVKATDPVLTDKGLVFIAK